MKNRTNYDISQYKQVFEQINARHQYLFKKVIPMASARALDDVMGKARTRAILAIRTKAKLPRWAVARKFPKKLQRKAQVADFNKKGKMTAKNHMITSPVPLVTLFGNSKNINPNDRIMEQIQKARKGVKAPKQPRIKDAFVGSGIRRVTDPKYNDYLEKTQGAGPKVLKGDHWQVMTRTTNKAYPVKIEGVELASFSPHVLKTTVSREYAQGFDSSFKNRAQYLMTDKVKF